MKRKRKKKAPRRKNPIAKWIGLLGLLALGSLFALFRWGPLELPGRTTLPPGRPVANTVELQIALARIGFSPGSVDGAMGRQTTQALAAFQETRGLPPSGTLDTETAALLRIEAPTHAFFELTATALDKITPPPSSWRERGELAYFGYHSALELIAEKSTADPDYIRELNPGLDWGGLQAGDRIKAPLVPPYRIKQPVDRIEIRLEERLLRALGPGGELLFQSPVSIARDVAKRPVGRLRVKVRVADPNYTFNPNILTAAAQREGITRKFVIQPGPNNPVGNVWLGLDRPSYGIHGTPLPEKVGRTESSGCFRLANWNAETLLDAVEVGTEVLVLP
ncbi:MAG: peptidoglycan-binding protein [Opitutales bacterium]